MIDMFNKRFDTISCLRTHKKHYIFCLLINKSSYQNDKNYIGGKVLRNHFLYVSSENTIVGLIRNYIIFIDHKYNFLFFFINLTTPSTPSPNTRTLTAPLKSTNLGADISYIVPTFFLPLQYNEQRVGKSKRFQW